MGGLGALLSYLGGVGMLHRTDAYPIRHELSHYAALNTHGGNCKQQKRKRLISHYIACKTDVSHISGKIHVRQKTQNATEQPEDGADACVCAYLNPHITCHLSTLHTLTRHAIPRHYHTPPLCTAAPPHIYTTAD